MTALPETRTLALELEAGWLTVRFAQPKVRNALTEAMVAELTAVLEAIEGDRAVRGVTFRGSGGVFCAGGDLKAFGRIFQGGGDREAVVAFSRAGGAFFRRLRALPQVTVMLVEGAAMAGGFGVACAGDIVIALADARFSLSEVRIGLTPAQILPMVLQRVGPRVGRRLALTAETLSGAQAGQVGLADYVAADTADAEHLERAIRQRVLRCAPGAVAVTKRLADAALHTSPDAMIDVAAEGFADCLLGAEAREGVGAFMQKRKPAWSVEIRQADER